MRPTLNNPQLCSNKDQKGPFPLARAPPSTPPLWPSSGRLEASRVSRSTGASDVRLETPFDVFFPLGGSEFSTAAEEDQTGWTDGTMELVSLFGGVLPDKFTLNGFYPRLWGSMSCHLSLQRGYYQLDGAKYCGPFGLLWPFASRPRRSR